MLGELGVKIGVMNNNVLNSDARSEELGLLVGDLKNISLKGNNLLASKYVIQNGNKTGNEYGVAIVNGEDTLQYFTSNMQNRIAIPIFNKKPNSIIIHHNHPFGDSFSRKDFEVLLTRAEIRKLWVHGHNGSTYSATKIINTLTKEDAESLLIKYMLKAKDYTIRAVHKNIINDYSVRLGLWQVVMAVLMEKDGVIKYTFNSNGVLNVVKEIIR